MKSFEYQSAPARIIFGSGTINQIPAELARLDVSRPLILSTPGQHTHHALQVQHIVRENASHIFSEATMHTPVEVTQRALGEVERTERDCVISIGGGSTVGLGKAICFRTGLHHICVPTTYAGSEVTSHLGETSGGRKKTISDAKNLPGTVIYDVDLTLSLPAKLTATSGVNAIAHAVEALYARDSNPIVRLLACEGIRSLATALPVLVSLPGDKTARSQALYGAWLCGTCLGSVGMALHHKLCHTLGGTFNMPHSETHTVILPHALAYNAPQVPETMSALAQVLPGSDGDALRGLNFLLQKLDVDRTLSSFGMKEEDIRNAADVVVSNPYWNPRDISKPAIEEVLRRAWAGEDARADL